MREMIIQINERNYINRYNELKIIKSKPSEIDPIMISMASKKRKREKRIRLERERDKIKSIINQIQREMIDAIEKKDDREIDRLIEVRGYYMRDLKNIEKEIKSL
jgi:trans-2-enoyl-CoA reductase